ncbi:hypothetical protein ACH4TX_05670 [Streptomyces sp. NPDC021098]|uniref:hypothetical protein n=1 Tax=unclassified Streptomyces TaxID=2593676 RepID=UPI00378D00DB
MRADVFDCRPQAVEEHVIGERRIRERRRHGPSGGGAEQGEETGPVVGSRADQKGA